MVSADADGVFIKIEFANRKEGNFIAGETVGGIVSLTVQDGLFPVKHLILGLSGHERTNLLKKVTDENLNEVN